MDIKLSYERYEEIKKIVIRLLVDLGISHIPISGFTMAIKMGIKVVPYSAYSTEIRGLLISISEDGFSLEKNPGQWFIFYNDKIGTGRINNTIMHEIAHIVLDHSENSDLAEKEANFFAKYALVPPVLINEFKVFDPLQIADRFGVSSEAASYALNYYYKWFQYGKPNYTDYEMQMLVSFKDTSHESQLFSGHTT